MEKHRAEALRLLHYLRLGSRYPDTLIERLLRELKKGNITLRSIGSSEEEIEELQARPACPLE